MLEIIGDKSPSISQLGESSVLKNKQIGESSRIIQIQEPRYDRNKFKKVEMPIFLGKDPNSWLFRVEQYFEIHKLSDDEKMIVSVISFDGVALAWYRYHENRDRFTDWDNLKT